MSRLSIVLHTHMPYVEGFGTWPFGEEWLWEAIACSYLPLLDVLDAAPGRVTLSVTPVLGDQLAAPGALARCLAFLREIRPASHALDLPAATPGEAAALEHSAAAYAWAADALAAGELAERMARHATWTSSATHAVLPLLATDAGVRRDEYPPLRGWVAAVLTVTRQPVSPSKSVTQSKAGSVSPRSM